MAVNVLYDAFLWTTHKLGGRDRWVGGGGGDFKAGGGGQVKFYPYKKKGRGGGRNMFWGSFDA